MNTPLEEEIIRQMWDLACTPLFLTDFEKKWEVFGWSPRPPVSPDEAACFVQVSEELQLNIGLNGALVDCAILSFFYWKEYEREWHESAETFEQEKKAFQAAYDEAFSRIEQTLGSASYIGQDKDEDAHCYAIWHGTTALLILQQAAFDVQFGLEVNLWLEPWGEEPFHPGPSLIDWLTGPMPGISSRIDICAARPRTLGSPPPCGGLLEALAGPDSG